MATFTYDGISSGGTQRIARMMPPGDALQFLLKGDQLRLNRAKTMKLVDAVVGLRIDEEDEVAGLDLSQHNESAYSLGLVGSTGLGSSWGASGH